METTDEKKSSETRKCGCPCHKMPGVFVVLIGVDILLRTLEVIGSKTHWIIISVLVILLGLQTMFRGRCNCCNAV